MPVPRDPSNILQVVYGIATNILIMECEAAIERYAVREAGPGLILQSEEEQRKRANRLTARSDRLATIMACGNEMMLPRTRAMMHRYIPVIYTSTRELFHERRYTIRLLGMS